MIPLPLMQSALRSGPPGDNLEMGRERHVQVVQELSIGGN